MEGHHDKPGCSLFDGNLINGIATDIINVSASLLPSRSWYADLITTRTQGCQRDRVPAEPREHFQAYQIQPLVEAIQALAWLAAQDAASPRHHQMDSSGKVLYFGQQASKTAGDYCEQNDVAKRRRAEWWCTYRRPQDRRALVRR